MINAGVTNKRLAQPIQNRRFFFRVFKACTKCSARHALRGKAWKERNVLAIFPRQITPVLPVNTKEHQVEC